MQIRDFLLSCVSCVGLSLKHPVLSSLLAQERLIVFIKDSNKAHGYNEKTLTFPIIVPFPVCFYLSVLLTHLAEHFIQVKHVIPCSFRLLNLLESTKSRPKKVTEGLK